MKRLFSVAAAIVIAVTCAAPAFAHGSCHGGAKAASYSVCDAEDCLRTGLHAHSGVIYTAHYYGDGHDYHEYCDIANCALAGYHEHDDIYCFGHTWNDGHGYHRSGKHRR